MTSPASTTTTSPRASSEARLVVPSRSVAVVSVRIARSASACALPRPSASASAKLPNTTVSHSQNATVNVNHAGSSPPPSGCRRRPGSARRVVMTAPTSTTNMTGLRTLDARVELARATRPMAGRRMLGARTASAAGGRSSRGLLVEGEVELEHVDDRARRAAEEAAGSVWSSIERRTRASGRLAPRGDPVGLDARVGLGDVRVDARGRAWSPRRRAPARRSGRGERPLALEVGARGCLELGREVLLVRAQVVEERRGRRCSPSPTAGSGSSAVGHRIGLPSASVLPCSREKSWPISCEPTTLPSRSTMRAVGAGPGTATWATPVMASG